MQPVQELSSVHGRLQHYRRIQFDRSELLRARTAFDHICVSGLMTSGLGVAGMAVGCAYLCISAANLKDQGLVLRLLEGNRKHLKPFGTKLQPESSSYCNPDAGMYMSGWRDLQREGQVRTCNNIVTFMRIHSHTLSLSLTYMLLRREA